MTAHHRPLSPHLQVYRLPLTGLISITHRMTGVLLAMGLVLFAYLLWSIVAGEAQYAAMQQFMALWPCRLVFWGFVYALLFHLSHGIRHLIWDSGKSFARAGLDRLAVYELIASALLTLTVWFCF